MKWDGIEWTGLTGLPTTSITAVALDRSADPTTVYAGTEGDGVFISRDGGITWTSFNEGLGSLSIRVLTIGEAPSPLLFTGTKYGGLWCRELQGPDWDYQNYIPVVVSS